MSEHPVTVDLVVRSDAPTKGGGDLVQAEAYRDRLTEIGHDVRTIPFSPGYAPRAGAVVHYMNADRMFELLLTARSARRAGRPLVVSPIHHPRSAMARLRRAERGHSLRALLARLPEPVRELLAFSSRTVRDGAPLRSRIGALLVAASAVPVLRSRMRAVLTRASDVLVLTDDEHATLGRDLALHVRTIVIGNGVPAAPGQDGPRRSEILVVGRIEQRKRQLELLREAERAGVPLVFIGELNPNAGGYTTAFAQEIGAASYCSWEGGMSHGEVTRRMAQAAVLVNMSWAEVQSLVEIEAAANGCAVVVNRDTGSRDWLGGSVRSFAADELPEALAAAAALAEHPDSHVTAYRTTWSEAVDALVAVYIRADAGGTVR